MSARRVTPCHRLGEALNASTPSSARSSGAIRTPSVLISTDFLIKAELPASWLMQISGTDCRLC